MLLQDDSRLWTLTPLSTIFQRWQWLLISSIYLQNVLVDAPCSNP